MTSIYMSMEHLLSCCILTMAPTLIKCLLSSAPLRCGTNVIFSQMRGKIADINLGPERVSRCVDKALPGLL